MKTTSLSTSAPGIAAIPAAIARALRGQPVDQVGHPGAAERAQRRPHRHAAGAPGQLRHRVHRVARPGSLHEVAGAHPHRRPQRGRRATIAMPQSYGTLSVLCASVAHESAASCPATRCRSRGDAAAHSPNAPSTCTQAPCSWATAMAGPNGSNAPECRLPACRQTIAGPLAAASALGQRVGSSRPSASAGDHRRRAEAEVAQRERRASRAARRRPARAPAAPPVSPSRSTSQPASRRAPAAGRRPGR